MNGDAGYRVAQAATVPDDVVGLAVNSRDVHKDFRRFKELVQMFFDSVLGLSQGQAGDEDLAVAAQVHRPLGQDLVRTSDLLRAGGLFQNEGNQRIAKFDE